ncbi:hypothetical protein GON01_07760 [Sphingomonas sp. MAH-20]|jgi:hypothetical protein|uniref:Uncharacterized protein n=1 Tax=Sphingomonas horti TaxID=2682842 RepID=A0A6I4IZY0_9SPHN|nr:MULTISPECIES: hypothetical protein [Sphingomonas]MBA2919947.1 hypothetical protein [Sphingomonas sp. CGMCC 1.13658]MVO77829.1 hypothetical protein [Sphingomonas horti]
MGGTSDIEWREGLYRQLARQPGLPAGLRPVLIQRAERCVDRRSTSMPAFLAPRGNAEGCKGAILG